MTALAHSSEIPRQARDDKLGVQGGYGGSQLQQRLNLSLNTILVIILKTLFILVFSPYNGGMVDETEIDFEHLKQYVGDDVSLTEEVFGLFKHQVDMWSKGLDPKADDDVWSGVMHSLKGTARAVGAKNLADLCERGEGLVGENASHALREKTVHDVQFSIDKALIEIGRWEYRQTLARMRS